MTEPSLMRRLAYRAIGEIHIPGRIRLFHIFKAIAQLHFDSGTIAMLDAGTGRGELVLHLARRYPRWRLRGIELDSERVAQCRRAAELLQLHNASFELGSLNELRPAQTYDLITCTDVLEHIEDDREALRRLSSALNPGGYLLLTFPSIPQRRHSRLVAWRERRIGFTPADIGHVRDGYSVDGITELLRACGLVLLKCQWTYGFFGTLAHDLFFAIGDNRPNPLVFGAMLPLLLSLSFLENHTPTRRGSGLLVLARAKEEHLARTALTSRGDQSPVSTGNSRYS